MWLLTKYESIEMLEMRVYPMFTKTDYLLFTQCEKALWLKKNQPNTLSKQENAGENEVFLHAMKRYPNGVKVAGESLEEREADTKRLVEEGVTVLYKPVVRFGGKLIACDIAQKSEKGWKVSKVTSATSIKKRLLDSLVFDWFDILEEIPSLEVEVIYLNKEYVRGETMDYMELFHAADVKQEILDGSVEVREALRVMERISSMPDCQIEIGPHCSKYGKDASDCPTKAHCWSHVPAYSVFNITRIGKKAWDLYDQGIIVIDDVPSDYKLSEAQRSQVEGEKKKEIIIDKKAIREFLNDFTHPLYFLDFETYQQPVPLYQGVKPYQQIPFQYSLHILPSLMDNLEHKEFLAQEGVDERRVLAERLVEDIPQNVTVVAYNMSFEKMVLRELAAIFPDLSFHLMNIHDHIVDLMTPFQKKWYYTPEMKGSYSIKYVLPALFPNDDSLDYNLLDVQNGSMAMETYAMLPTLSEEERIQARKNLLSYCQLDTYAMVRIWEELNFL